MDEASRQAEHFLKNDTAFRLGMLPTENSNPKTRTFAETVQADTLEGIRQLLAVDQDVGAAAQSVFSSEVFGKLTDDLAATFARKGRVVFSGCGATGRLSILLEAEWRRFWRRLAADGRVDGAVAREMEDQVFSVMTGGDFALVRSVENFEDYAAFGAEQLAALGFSANDLLIAVSEGGETSSVIGTIREALKRGSRAYFAYNNPTDVLTEHIVRSRDVIQAPEVRAIELFSGEMAVAGSTRMQAVTFELLVLGAALEIAALRTLKRISPIAADNLPDEQAPDRYAKQFASLVGTINTPAVLKGMAAWIELEETVYAAKGLVTYFGHHYLLDLFTDTTERSPTFMLPPFRKADDTVSPPSWAFVKDLFMKTEEAWFFVYQRTPRGLEWTPADYTRMGVPESIVRNPPAISFKELMKIRIGCEPDPARFSTAHDMALLAHFESEASADQGEYLLAAFDKAAEPFARKCRVTIMDGNETGRNCDADIALPCRIPTSPLRLWHHLAIKLIMNTVSTATMGRMERIRSNWMIQVHPTNKKLIDRGTRLIAELAGLSYEKACHALYESMAELADDPKQTGTISPVAHAIERLQHRPNL